MTQISVAQKSTGLCNAVTIALALRNGVYYIGGSFMQGQEYYNPVTAARAIRSAAAVQLRKGKQVQLAIDDLARVRLVVDLLNVIPAQADPMRCVYFCSVAKQFYLPRAVTPTADPHTIWTACAVCSADRGTGAHYNADNPQAHPATVGGARA